MSVHEMMRIDELDELNGLYRLVDQYREQNGAGPFNLSHWDPSAETVQELTKHLQLPLLSAPSPYVYPGDLELQQSVMEQLGVRPSQRCLIVHAGTNAILFAMWWLRQIQTRSITIVCPAYFPVFYAAKISGVNHRAVFMNRTAAKWRLPCEELDLQLRNLPGTQAIWITSPVYCTGKYLEEIDLQYLQSLLDSGVVIVADECLAASGHELARRFGDYPNFLGIYSPHKSVCLNSVKFALLAFDSRYQQFFRDWADVLIGGLNSANQVAVRHYLSDNFATYQGIFMKSIQNARNTTEELLSSRGMTVDLDPDPIGHFMTCYFPGIPADAGNGERFMKTFMNETGALVIPGLRNHFGESHGFTFRINLARACPQFYSSLVRAIRFLEGVRWPAK